MFNQAKVEPGSRDETLRRRHLADAVARGRELIERLGWSADRLAGHRTARGRESVGYAADRSPWHRERLAGVDADRLEAAGLRQLPPMTKTDVIANFDQIVTDEWLSLKLVRAHLATVATDGYLLDSCTSGGSSGERGVFVYDWEG
jgi:phenylacetate-CoA ligase